MIAQKTYAMLRADFYGVIPEESAAKIRDFIARLERVNSARSTADDILWLYHNDQVFCGAIRRLCTEIIDRATAGHEHRHAAARTEAEARLTAATAPGSETSGAPIETLASIASDITRDEQTQRREDAAREREHWYAMERAAETRMYERGEHQ